MEDLVDPQEVKAWHFVEQTARKLLEHAGFQEIRTPILEDADLFERSVGETTDIVEKEMYTLTDRNEKRLALRPEGTASVVRAFIEHFTQHNILEGRFYYLGPMYRYERPQQGRYRQFYQIGAESFGTDHPLADAEIIGLLWQLFTEFKLENLTLEINSLGSRECRERYLQALNAFLKKNRDRFNAEVQKRIDRNPLRVLDSKDSDVIAALQDAPNIQDSLSEESKAHFAQVQEALQALSIPFKINPRMVRGLDYYEKTVFEFVSPDLGAQNTVAAGGRYNDLVSDLGGPSVPAVGFALGLERLMSLLPAEKIPQEERPRVYLVGLDEIADREHFQRIPGLKEVGALVQLDLGGGGLKNKLKRASRWKADWVVIIGEEERKKGVAILRNMQGSSQEEVPEEELFTKLLSKFPTLHYLG